MSLAARIIPTLLMSGDKLVKGQRFGAWRTVGHIEQAMRIYQARKADEVILLDIAATPEGRGPDFARIKALTHGFFTPVTVGGGVRSLRDVRDLLASGADKVAICSWAPAIVKLAAERFGSQAIVYAIDVTNGKVAWECGKSVSTTTPLEQARCAEAEGAGEILLTSIDREGTLEGYDIPLIEAVAQAASIPVIAHGGCSCYYDMKIALKAGASAVAAGALFQFTDATPRGAAEYLATHGIETRIPA